MTGEKEKLTVTVDPDVRREARGRAEFNVSGFVNEALRSYLFSGAESPEDAVLRERQRLAEERLALYQEQVADARAELDHIEKVRSEREATETDEDELWAQAEAALLGNGQDPDRLDVGHPAVENWAEKLDVMQVELLDELGLDPVQARRTDGGEETSP